MISVDAGVLALLSGFLVGEGVKPAAGGWQGAPGTSQFKNYLIFVPSTGMTDGSLADPDSDVERFYTLQCVSNTQTGCRILAGNVIAAVRGKRIVTATRVTTGPITVDRWGSIDPDDTVQPRLYVASHVIRVDTTPV